MQIAEDDILRERKPVAIAYLTWAVTTEIVLIAGFARYAGGGWAAPGPSIQPTEEIAFTPLCHPPVSSSPATRCQGGLATCMAFALKARICV